MSILKLAREGGRKLAPERLDMPSLVQAQADTVRHRIDELEGRVTIEGALPVIEADRLAVEQIFANLLDNAVKYRDPSRPPEITVTGVTSGGRATFVVRDNGRGIAAGDLTRVFDLFRRVGGGDMAGEGIGLAHVRSMVHRLGGEIELSSELGRGTTFTVVLPQRFAGQTSA